MSAQPSHLSAAAIPALARGRDSRVLWAGVHKTHTWLEFAERVAEMIRHCRSVGVEPGEVVLIPADNGFESIAWGFAGASVGAIVLPLRAERIDEVEGFRSHFEIAWQVQDDRLMYVGEGSNSEITDTLFAQLRLRGHPGLILFDGRDDRDTEAGPARSFGPFGDGPGQGRPRLADPPPHAV